MSNGMPPYPPPPLMGAGSPAPPYPPPPPAAASSFGASASPFGIKPETGSGTPMLQGPTTSTSSSAPPLPPDASQTLYIQNLNEKVKLPIMKATLENLFSNYGKVLSVTAHTNLRMRGQAFVALDDTKAADRARREVQSFPLYGRAMKIHFAKSSSDAVVVQQAAKTTAAAASQDADEGAPKQEDRVAAVQAALEAHKAARLEHKKMARRGNVLRRKELERKIRARRAAAGEVNTEPSAASITAASNRKQQQQELPDEYLPPNKLLFLQNIPEGVGKDELESLFSAYSGYIDVQTIPGKADIAFVEFTDIPSSVTARGALNGYNFGAGDKLKITFAR